MVGTSKSGNRLRRLLVGDDHSQRRSQTVAAVASDYRLIGGTVGDLTRETRGVAVPAAPAGSPSRRESPMSRNTHESELVVVPLWSRVQVVKARPYIASMLHSL